VGSARREGLHYSGNKSSIKSSIVHILRYIMLRGIQDDTLAFVADFSN